MENKTVICNNCMVKFFDDELIQLVEITENEEEDIYTGCPNCKTDEWLMNLQDE